MHVRESMRNGGGPACLRLRVVLNSEQAKAVHPAFILDHAKIDRLRGWVNKHYRDRVSADDLVEVAFAREVQTALEDLASLLASPDLYAYGK